MSDLSITLAIPQHLNPNGLTVRMAGTSDVPMWCLADICKVLEIKNPHRTADQLDEDDRTQSTVTDSLGRKQQAWFVTEAGLYTVLVRSDKPQAKPFRKWVCGEVLPCIRKHGCYPAPTVVPCATASEELTALREAASAMLSVAESIKCVATALGTGLQLARSAPRCDGLSRPDSCTLRRWLDSQGIVVSGEESSRIGRSLSWFCREKVIPIGKDLNGDNLYTHATLSTWWGTYEQTVRAQRLLFLDVA